MPTQDDKLTTATREYRKCCEDVVKALRKKRLAEARLAKTKAEEETEPQSRDGEVDTSNTRLVTCSLCHTKTPESTAHRHQGKWICDDGCWDSRLKVTE